MKILIFLLTLFFMSLNPMNNSTEISETFNTHIVLEKIQYNNDAKDYAVIDNDKIDIYVSTSSGSYIPEIKNLNKKDDILNVDIALKSYSEYITCDMAYWKLTIQLDLEFVNNINSIVLNIIK